MRDETCVVCCIIQNRMQDVKPCRSVMTTDLDSFSWSTAIFLLKTCPIMMHYTFADLILDLHSRLHESACSSLMQQAWIAGCL